MQILETRKNLDQGPTEEVAGQDSFARVGRKEGA